MNFYVKQPKNSEEAEILMFWMKLHDISTGIYQIKYSDPQVSPYYTNGWPRRYDVILISRGVRDFAFRAILREPNKAISINELISFV